MIGSQCSLKLCAHLFILSNARLIKVYIYYTPERYVLLRHKAIRYNIEMRVGRPQMQTDTAMVG